MHVSVLSAIVFIRLRVVASVLRKSTSIIVAHKISNVRRLMRRG